MHTAAATAPIVATAAAVPGWPLPLATAVAGMRPQELPPVICYAIKHQYKTVCVQRARSFGRVIECVSKMLQITVTQLFLFLVSSDQFKVLY